MNYKEKIRKNLKPIGIAIGNLNLYLTNSNGDIIVSDLNSGSIVNKKKNRKQFSFKTIYI